MEEVGGPKFTGEEEQLMGNSMKWACIYVYAVGKVAQSEGKVCGEEQRHKHRLSWCLVIIEDLLRTAHNISHVHTLLILHDRRWFLASM